jgi:predicted nucleotidyltransferase
MEQAAGMGGKDMKYHALDIDDVSKVIIPLLPDFYIRKASIFGSCARGEMQRGSDIDLLVEFTEMKSGFALIELKRKIENRLGRSVDVITMDALKMSEMKERVISEAVVIYDEGHRDHRSYV